MQMRKSSYLKCRTRMVLVVGDEDRGQRRASFKLRQLKLLLVGTRLVGSLETTPGSGQRELFWEQQGIRARGEHGADMVVDLRWSWF